MKKYILRVCAIALLVIAAVGCKSVDDIKVTSCSLVSLSPKGLRSADVVLAVGIDNPIMAFNITDLQGTVRVGEKTAATFSVDSVAVEAKTSKTYEIPFTAALDKSMTLMNAMSMISGNNLSDLKMDVSARISTKKGLGKTVSFNDIAIAELLNL